MDYTYLGDLVYGHMMRLWYEKIKKEVLENNKYETDKEKKELEELLGEENKKKLQTYVHGLSLMDEEIYFLLAQKIVRYSVYIGMELQKDFDGYLYE